jgi:integrase/recombinase XerD
MPASNALLISDFLGYLQYECGASEKAIAAHERSLAELAAWLKPMWLPDASRTMLQLYIGNSLQQGTSAGIIARRLSHFRHFYQFLLNQKEMESDPTLDLPMTKHWKTAKAGKEGNSFTMVTWIRMEWDAY